MEVLERKSKSKTFTYKSIKTYADSLAINGFTVTASVDIETLKVDLKKNGLDAYINCPILKFY